MYIQVNSAFQENKEIQHKAHCTNGLELSENPTLFQGKVRILEIQPYQQRRFIICSLYPWTLSSLKIQRHQKVVVFQKEVLVNFSAHDTHSFDMLYNHCTA